MLRSGKLPYEAVREATRNRASSHTVYRPDNSVEGWGEQADTYTTTTADIDFTGQVSTRTDQPAGEDTDIVLNARVLDTADIEVQDLVVYRGNVLQVRTKDGRPTGESPQFYTLGLIEKDDVTEGQLP